MESLKAFVTPEKLEEPNQYECSKCKEKRDAHKGLKFKKLPYLLTLQLKRFDFDYSTMHRIKLNDRMEFPTELDLNDLICEIDDKRNGNCDSDGDKNCNSEVNSAGNSASTSFEGKIST